MHYAHSQAQINTVQGKHFCHSQFGNPKALHGRFLKFTNVCKNSFHSNCFLCTSWRMRIVDCVNSCSSNRLLATPLPSEKLRPHPPARPTDPIQCNPLCDKSARPTDCQPPLQNPKRITTQPLPSLDPQFVNPQGPHVKQLACLTKTANLLM